MTDHLHGLCKNCIPQCREMLYVGRNEEECGRCNDAEPTVIVEDEEGQTVAICTKCYLKDSASPKKSEVSKMKASSILSKQQPVSQSNSPIQVMRLAIPLAKADLMSKGFFSSEGKMVRRVQKYMTKFQSTQALFKDLSKRSIVHAPIMWQKLTSKCDKVGSLLYVLVAKSHIFGCYHNEPCRIGEKGFEDTESGFFMSLRPKLDLQYYKPSYESVVTYGPTARSVGIGKPACFEVVFGKEIKVKCELVPMFSEWIYQFVVKV